MNVQGIVNTNSTNYNYKTQLSNTKKQNQICNNTTNLQSQLAQLSNLNKANISFGSKGPLPEVFMTLDGYIADGLSDKEKETAQKVFDNAKKLISGRILNYGDMIYAVEQVYRWNRSEGYKEKYTRKDGVEVDIDLKRDPMVKLTGPDGRVAQQNFKIDPYDVTARPKGDIKETMPDGTEIYYYSDGHVVCFGDDCEDKDLVDTSIKFDIEKFEQWVGYDWLQVPKIIRLASGKELSRGFYFHCSHEKEDPAVLRKKAREEAQARAEKAQQDADYYYNIDRARRLRESGVAVPSIADIVGGYNSVTYRNN